MAGNYGMPDAASVMGAAHPPAAAAVALSGGVTPARPGGTPANVDQRDWLGNPIRSGAIEFVDGKGYRRRKGTDANGNVIYQDLTAGERQANAGRYSFAREDAELDRRRTEAAQGELAKRDAANRAEDKRRYGAELDLKTKGLEAQLEGIKQQGENNAAQIKLAQDQMQRTSADRALDRQQGADQFNRTEDRTARAMELNNQLMSRKLDVEDRHFQQKLAYDKRMDRRAQIISSLSLVAQSLARL